MVEIDLWLSQPESTFKILYFLSEKYQIYLHNFICIFLNSILVLVPAVNEIFLWPAEIPCLKDGDFSYVTVEVGETTLRGQSSQRVSVLDDGSFVVSSRWILETPGKYELSESTGGRPSSKNN